MFVYITEDLMVNSDMISAIEIRSVRDKRILVVHVGNKTHTATVSPEELLAKLKTLGIGDQYVRM